MLNKFDAIHGTTVTNAGKICNDGFIIFPDPCYKNRYGPGVYFIENSEQGIKYALERAKIKSEEKQNNQCYIEVIIEYYNYNAYFFDRKGFDKLYQQIDSYNEASKEEQNRIRLLFIADSIKKTKKDVKIIFAEFPVGIENSVYIDGCVVSDINLLPNKSTFKVIKK
jgi:hypothetical protein